ncbi:hypothetical protein BGW80DRAFT_1461393 [Lactifluus volemus]|nr:hypothetical protein BGW80DRAFT_1461393 [Lactifluus volemus]
MTHPSRSHFLQFFVTMDPLVLRPSALVPQHLLCSKASFARHQVTLAARLQSFKYPTPTTEPFDPHQGFQIIYSLDRGAGAGLFHFSALPSPKVWKRLLNFTAHACPVAALILVFFLRKRKPTVRDGAPPPLMGQVQSPPPNGGAFMPPSLLMTPATPIKALRIRASLLRGQGECAPPQAHGHANFLPRPTRPRPHPRQCLLVPCPHSTRSSPSPLARAHLPRPPIPVCMHVHLLTPALE